MSAMHPIEARLSGGGVLMALSEPSVRLRARTQLVVLGAVGTADNDQRPITPPRPEELEVDAGFNAHDRILRVGIERRGDPLRQRVLRPCLEHERLVARVRDRHAGRFRADRAESYTHALGPGLALQCARYTAGDA